MKPSFRLEPWLLLLPTGAALAVFFVYPLVEAAYRSLFAWDLLTPPRFVGLANYRSLVRTGTLGGSLLTTLFISALTGAGSLVAGLALALALNRPGRLAALCRSAVFSAYVISWVTVGLLFAWLFDADAGLVNRILGQVGVEPVRWLTSPAVAPVTVALVVVWKLTGYAMVLFLSGLSGLPPEVLEAAELDGAGARTRLLRVTLPLLRPTLAFVTTTSLIASFALFDVVRLLTQGGPVRSTTVLVYAIYEELFRDLRVGRASALVVVFFAVLLGLSLLKFRLLRGSEAR